MTHTDLQDGKTLLGFWMYLMTDLVLFATLFATFAVLRSNIYGGPSGHEIFSLPLVLIETLILLTSSFTCGLAVLAVQRRDKRLAFALFCITLLLGAAFLGLELGEFIKLVHEGNGWRRSGFLSAFFTLVGTHGLHILTGMLWLLTLLEQLYRKGFKDGVVRRLTLFSMFWHFLDIVWIFIFSVVYLWGGVK